KHNQRHKKLINLEKEHLQTLPAHRTIDFDEITARVSTTSTMIVKKVMYSVPSRLIGNRLRVHIYDDRLICYLGGEKTLELHN
ncbi:MAG: IS21 family transposase, partial [Alphaproteobacteria bacterium]